MTDQHNIPSLDALANQKGGTPRAPRETTVEDALVQMAQAHARIARQVSLQSGNPASQGIVNSNITSILDLVFEDAPKPFEWYNLYNKTFWSMYLSK